MEQSRKGPVAAWPFPEESNSSEALLDSAVEATFPASDPISVEDGFHAKRRRDHARLTHVKPAGQSQNR
jgi:hypothetical protein